VLHGAAVGFPGDLENAVLPVEVCEILKPLTILLQLGELYIGCQGLCHRGFLL
jgi:hypothetical protein